MELPVKTAVPPLPELAQLVETVHVVGPTSGKPLRTERLPDGSMSLLFRLTAGSADSSQSSRAGELSIAGPRTRALYNVIPDVLFAIYVRFRPGRGLPFLGVAASELTDGATSVDDVWGKEGLELRDRILAAAGPREMLKALQHGLAARAGRAVESTSELLARRAVSILESSPPSLRIDELAASLGASTRHLRRVFAATVGVGPREFARTVRLRRAVEAAAWESSLTNVALMAGYYDQAHMNADFRDLLDATPREFVRSRRRAVVTIATEK
jgi:AraC-like DNA-binding protein